MNRFLLIVLSALLMSSCAQWSESDQRKIASESQVIDQKDFLAAMIGRKPIRTLTDLINEGASADELAKYNFYAVHPVIMVGYYPVNIISEKGDGYYILEAKVDVKVVTPGFKTSDGTDLGPGTMGFNKKFADHSNNIIFEMPNGAFNRSDFVVGKNICTKPGKSFLKMCGTILRIYSSGELLLKLKTQTTIAAIEFF